MAIKLPTYNTQVDASAPLAAGGAAGGQVSTAEGRGLEQLGDQIGHLGAVVQEYDNRKSLNDAQVAVAQAHADMFEHLRQSQDAAPDDPTGFTPGYMKDFDQYRDKLIGGIANPVAQQYAKAHMAQLATTLQDKAITWEAQRAATFNVERIENATGAYSRVVALDDTQYPVVREALHNLVETSKLPPALRERARDHIDQTLTTAAAEGFMQRAPRLAQSLINKRLGIPAESEPAADPSSSSPVTAPDPTPGAQGPVTPQAGGFDSAVSWVLSKEGGYVGSDGASKAPAKFGINQKANPDVDVANLTRDKAVELYRSRYWDKIDGDKLPPDLQMVAFDAAVQHGPETAARLLRESGGSAEAFIEKRRQLYQDLAAKRPEDQKNLAGWNARMDALTAQVNTIRQTTGTPTAIADTAAAQLTDVDAPRSIETINVTGKVDVPFLDRMDAKQLLHAKERADHLVRTDQVEAQAEIRAALHNAGAQAEHGVVPAMPDPGLIARAAPGKTAGIAAQFGNLQTFASTISRVQTMTAPEMSAAIMRLQPDGITDPNWASRAAEVAHFQKAATAVIKQRNTDPMLAAMEQKLGQVNPLDFSDPAKAGAELAQRQGVAMAMVDKYGAPSASAMTKDESKAYGENFHRLTTGQQLDVLTTMRTSLTNPRVYRETVTAFAKDSPVTLAAADLATRSDANRAPDGTPAKDVAYGLLEGERLLNPDKYAKKEDGKGAVYTLPPTTGAAGMDAAIAKELGPAFLQDAAGFDRAKQAIHAYYAHLSAKAGAYAETQFDSDRLDKAIDSTMGARSKWAQGFFTRDQRVLMPWGMTDEEFRPQLANAYDRAMRSSGLQGGPLDRPKDMQLLRLDEHRYGLRIGAAAIKGPGGYPLILDLSPTEAAP